MTAGHVASVVLVVAGTVVIVAASIAALLAPDKYARLHYVTPVTSLGAPLLGVGLSVGAGLGLTTASILLPVGLLFFSSPILSAAIGRAATQREGRGRPEPPE